MRLLLPTLLLVSCADTSGFIRAEPLAFDAVDIASPPSGHTRYARLTWTGISPLWAKVHVVGDEAFTLGYAPLGNNLELLPGDTVVPVTFAPSDERERGGMLVIAPLDPAEPGLRLPLTGSGVWLGEWGPEPSEPEPEAIVDLSCPHGTAVGATTYARATETSLDLEWALMRRPHDSSSQLSVRPLESFFIPDRPGLYELRLDGWHDDTHVDAVRCVIHAH